MVRKKKDELEKKRVGDPMVNRVVEERETQGQPLKTTRKRVIERKKGSPDVVRLEATEGPQQTTSLTRDFAQTVNTSRAKRGLDPLNNQQLNKLVEMQQAQGRDITSQEAVQEAALIEQQDLARELEAAGVFEEQPEERKFVDQLQGRFEGPQPVPSGDLVINAPDARRPIDQNPAYQLMNQKEKDKFKELNNLDPEQAKAFEEAFIKVAYERQAQSNELNLRQNIGGILEGINIDLGPLNPENFPGPSDRASDLVAQVQNIQSLAGAEASDGPNLAPRTALKQLDHYSDEVDRIEAKLQTIIITSPVLRANPDKLQQFQKEIHDARKEIFFARQENAAALISNLEAGTAVKANSLDHYKKISKSL